MKEIPISRNILVASILLLQLVNVSSTAKLEKTGGYGIVIALQGNTPQPNNAPVYLENIKKIFQEFSINLYISTKQKFFVEFVDLIIPQNWEGINSVGLATSQSYRTADIRIQNENGTPRVDNPNACGSAGNFIEVPSSFFDKSVYGNYGSPGKALLNMWARYRFGVWEEHGYPNEYQFPYVYQKPSLNPVWSATGCSNTELHGTFINRYGENCTTDENDKPDEECKFSPSPSNTAVSSLLHFPWLHSVTEFCDMRTHNYAAPNRQNFLCGHRSVWDVIKETADYRMANGRSVEMVPVLKYNILTESQKPLFYLLVDNGRSSYPVEIVREIMTTIGTFYNNDIKNIGAIGSFPNMNPRSNSYVTENVPWSPISTSTDIFITALEDLISNDGAVVRDFGAAILEVVEQIKLRDHKAGAVVLIVKRGVGANTFDRMSYEQEIIASLYDQTNIKLLAIELQENEKIPYTNLNHIVECTEGEHLLIKDKMNTARKLAPILATVKDLLKAPIVSTRKFRTIIKQFLNANEKEFEIPVFEEEFEQLELHITTSSFVRTSDIEMKQVTSYETYFQTSERKEWDENDDSSKRSVHTFTIKNPPKDSVWSVRYACSSEHVKDCIGFFVVYGLNENSIKTSEDSVDLIVTTSADDGFVDMSRQGPKPVPFSVYAKIEMNGQPILNVKDVQAIIRLSDNSKSWKIPLVDDGNGNPDVSFGDGVYSNLFIPSEDGFYRISVLVTYYNNTDGQDAQASGIGQLLPVNQHQIGCYNSTDKTCIPAKPSRAFLKVSDLPGRVAIENCATFKTGRPMKITDFEVTVLPNFRVMFTFTSPKLLGSDDSPQEFQIFMAPSPNNYLGSTDMTKLLVAQIGEKPGNRLQIPYYTMQTAIPYYAVEAIYNDMRSGPSNIVGVNTGIPSPTTTTQKPSTPIITTGKPSTMFTSTTTGTSTTTSLSSEKPSSTTFEYSTTTETNSGLKISFTAVHLTHIIIAVSVLYCMF